MVEFTTEICWVCWVMQTELTGWEPSRSSVAAQEKVPTPLEQEFAKDLLSIWDRPTSASFASPFFSSTFADFISCIIHSAVF